MGNNVMWRICHARLVRLGGGCALAGLLLMASGIATAQALRPLPPAFLAVLDEADAVMGQVVGSAKRVPIDEIRAPGRAQIDETIGRLEKSLAQARAQSAELRRRESLLVLLALNSAIGGVHHDMAAYVTMLHGATVRNAPALDALNTQLTALDGQMARLNAVVARFNSGTQQLLERLDRAPPAPAQ